MSKYFDPFTGQYENKEPTLPEDLKKHAAEVRDRMIREEWGYVNRDIVSAMSKGMNSVARSLLQPSMADDLRNLGYIVLESSLDGTYIIVWE